MKKRLFIFSTLMVFIGLLCFFAASVYITYSNNLNIAKDTVMETVLILAGFYGDDTDASSFVKVGDDTRITVILPDGSILADSRPLDVGLMENHLDRPEVQAALNAAPETFVRYSDSLGVDLIFYALKIDLREDFVIIRAGIPVAKIDAYLIQSLPLLLFVLIVIVLICFILSRGMINRITKPFESIVTKLRLLANGEYTSESTDRSYEEIEEITNGINGVAQVLQDSFISLQDEKNKVEYILNNISDGIFAVDNNKNIKLFNASALSIFDTTPNIRGKNMSHLVYDKTLSDAVDDCLSAGKNSLIELSISGRIFLVTVKQLPETNFTMVILSDITEARVNEKRREDFFANASHELKTPLTAIKGFNELTAINNKDENIEKYVGSIARETDRMLSLIEDMLKLSELENSQKLAPVPVSLAKVAGEVRETLLSALSEKSISLEIIGDSTVEAESGHIYELVKNLVENAVRYNNQNGMVSVKIESNNKDTLLFVSDNGIGISPEEHIRIFERFYRVEKSRYQRSGGTGLGLSIVKHICALYGWNLSLKSKPGVGTEITIAFAHFNSKFSKIPLLQNT